MDKQLQMNPWSTFGQRFLSITNARYRNRTGPVAVTPGEASVLAAGTRNFSVYFGLSSFLSEAAREY